MAAHIDTGCECSRPHVLQQRPQSLPPWWRRNSGALALLAITPMRLPQ